MALAACLFVLVAALAGCNWEGPDGGPTTTPFFSTPQGVPVPGVSPEHSRQAPGPTVSKTPAVTPEAMPLTLFRAL